MDGDRMRTVDEVGGTGNERWSVESGVLELSRRLPVFSRSVPTGAQHSHESKFSMISR